MYSFVAVGNSSVFDNNTGACFTLDAFLPLPLFKLAANGAADNH